VVVIFGVGTDYCLFLVSRFREELRRKERPEARASAITQITPVIAASALTVIVAFMSMGISRFGMDKTMGYAMAIGVGVTLLAGLTLVPALMSLFGKYLFWPGNPAAVKKRRPFGLAYYRQLGQSTPGMGGRAHRNGFTNTLCRLAQPTNAPLIL